MDAEVEAVSLLVAMGGGYHGHDGIRRWWGNMLDVFPDWAADVVEVRDLGDLTLSAVVTRGHGASSDLRLNSGSDCSPSGVTTRSSGGALGSEDDALRKPPGCRNRQCQGSS